MKESEIRPADIFKRYLELSAADAERHFKNDERVSIPCVACGSKDLSPEFRKLGFSYSTCNNCRTLFQTPRPSVDAFEGFYRDSISSRYWAETFFPAVAEARREKIFKPRVERLAALCAERGLIPRSLVDVGAGYGIFLEEWRRILPETSLLAIEPSVNLAQTCRGHGFDVVQDIVENVTGYENSSDLVVCFEVLEHAYDPVALIKSLARLAKPGGYVFVSTLGVDGFDIQTLWDRSDSISPPHHINFLSIPGFEAAFARAGLVDVGITTPGKLDVDIVRNAFRRDAAVLKDSRFAKFIVEDDERGALFQTFLASHQMSSHVWVLARKPG